MSDSGNISDDAISRREFLSRCGKAGLAIGAAGGVSRLLYRPGSYRPSPAGGPEVQLGNYAVAGTDGRIGIVTGPDRLKTLQRAVKAIGGIETYIKPGDRVLLKVNAAFASPPMLSATTNPQLVSELVRLCVGAGADRVIVTDNPINDSSSCFAFSGIGPAAKKAGARLVLPSADNFRPTTVPGGKLIANWPLLYGPFESVNKVIGVAPVKDHHRSGASMTMKNWYGLLGGRRNTFHQDIHNAIKELAMMVRPTLVVLDGTTTMMTNGPTGGSLDDLKNTNTMIVSTDQVAADAFGATLLGRSADQLPYIVKAAAMGVGTSDFESLSPARSSMV